MNVVSDTSWDYGVLQLTDLSTPRDMILANKKKWAFKRRYILFYEPESLAT